MTREPLTLGIDMVDVTDARKNIQEESVRSRSSISESVGFILAGAINFINKRQNDKHSWHLNGDYSQVQASEVGDGVFICLENMEITGYSIYNGRSGTGQNTIVDLRYISSDGTDNGSIFSTKPEISPSAADGSFSSENLLNGGSEQPTGHTLGVFSKINFDKFDGIKLALDQSSGGAEDLQVTIYFRPR